MSYDYRSSSDQIPMYRQSTSSSSPATLPVYGSSMYPRVAQSGPPNSAPPPLRPAPSPSPYHQSPHPQSSPGLGIRVAIKPEYRITPPPHMLPQVGDIPRCNFQFDFEVERRILAEVEKENQNWSRLGLESLASRNSDSTSPTCSVTDPVVSKYIASGLSREAVPLAVHHYGDDPTKVPEFVNAYTLLREMGFSSTSVAEALVMYDNDTDKALAHFLNSSS